MNHRHACAYRRIPALAAPLPLSAVALLALDDQALERAFPGALTGKLSTYGDAQQGCGTDSCWATVEAEGAGSVRLPSLGEIRPTWERPHDPGAAATPLAAGEVFLSVPFVLVGDAPVAGAAPPARVRRICCATPSSSAGALEVACEGDRPEAACSRTLTRRPPPP